MRLPRFKNICSLFCLVYLLLFIGPSIIGAQEAPVAAGPELAVENEVPENAPDPTSIADKKPLVITAGFSASGGFASGWTSWDKASLGLGYLDPKAGVIISTSLAFKARFNKDFSFQGGVTAVYPNTPEARNNPSGDMYVPPPTNNLAVSTDLFAVTLGDIFADYSIADALFIKVGRYGQTWGNSYFFKSADIINRYTTGMLSDGLRLKMTVPIGVANISVLGQAFNGYFTDISAVNLTAVGVAAYVDVPIGPVELGVGAFYQRKLTPRFIATVKSSISPLDFFLDASLAIDPTSEERPQATNRAYFSISAGVYGDVREILSQFYLEYLFNGERGFNTVSNKFENQLPDSYQPGGHNISLLWRLKLEGSNSVQPVAQFAYNFNDCSAVIIPGLNIQLTENLKLQLGLPISLGPNGVAGGEAAYLSQVIIQGHVIGFTVRLRLSGSASSE